VGRGFTQEEGVNYDETYAQMMRTETFKILLVIALYRNWAIRQWDVVAAYLQALLKHDIYITDTNEDGLNRRLETPQSTIWIETSWPRMVRNAM